MVPFQGPHGRSAVFRGLDLGCLSNKSNTNVDSSPGVKARVIEVSLGPRDSHLSLADTIGNFAYTEGDVLKYL